MIFNSKKPALHTGCQYDISSNRLFIHLRSGKHGWLIKSLLEVFFSLGESLKKNWLIPITNFLLTTKKSNSFPILVDFQLPIGWFPIFGKLVVWLPEGIRQHQPNIDPSGQQIQLLRHFQRCFGPGQHARSWGGRGIDQMVGFVEDEWHVHRI